MQLRSLKTKLIIYIIPLILFVALSFLFFYIYRSNHFIKEELTDFGFHLARDLSYASELAIASEDPVLLQSPFEGTFEEKEVVLVTVYNKKGNIIASKKKIEVEERISKDIMEALLKEKKALKISCYTKDGEEVYCFYSPVVMGETLTPATTEARKVIGFVGVGLSLEKIKTQTKEILVLGLSTTALVVLFGIFILYFLAGNLIKPIDLLHKGAEIIAKGNLDYKVNIKTGDEIEQLANEFNRMTESLKESREKLEKRIEQLERFHKLTIGRELRMIELKKEIKKLKEKFDNQKRNEK